MHFAQTVRKSHRVLTPHQSAHTKRRYSSSTQNNRLPAHLVWPKGANPTPYQILDMEPEQKYDKRKFNHMVKMYHPDMLINTKDGGALGISSEMRLHRYYLIIAAHELLNNPEQRRRYDLYKLGWMKNAPGIGHEQQQHQSCTETWNTPADAPDSTWPMRQAPIYMSNGAFAIMALVIAFGYAIISHERVRRAAWREKQRMHLVNTGIVKSLYDAEYLVPGRSKDDRILDFLCHRHATSGQNDSTGGFLPFGKDWEENMCRH